MRAFSGYDEVKVNNFGERLKLGGHICKVLEAKISDKDSTFSPGTICEINKDSIGVCTKDKVILITKVKPFGKKAMDAKDYINGLNKEKTLHSIAE